MTQEEKARAYDEALEIAKKEWSNNLDNAYKNYRERLEIIFPELKESEDERISREITEFILTHRIDEPNDIEDTNSWLVWLEKQVEKPQGKTAIEAINEEVVDNANKVGPKFKVGDCVISDCNNVAYIESISGTKYNLQCKDGYHEKMSIEYVDRCWHLLTIEDVKEW